MSEKSRRWFQIHLSTAIVLMFVAGGLLWGNLHPYERSYLEHMERDENGVLIPSKTIYGTQSEYGWPQRIRYNDSSPEATGGPRLTYDTLGWKVMNIGKPLSIFSVEGLLLNLAAAIAALSAVAFTLEYLIRRREARKP